MEQSKRNEPSRSIAAREGLLLALRKAGSLNGIMFPPSLKEAIAWLYEYVEATEQRLAMVETAVLRARDMLSPKLREQLDQLVTVALQEGQLMPGIHDADRPGGPMPGDIIAGPKPLRVTVNFIPPGESYGGTD